MSSKLSGARQAIQPTQPRPVGFLSHTKNTTLLNLAISTLRAKWRLLVVASLCLSAAIFLAPLPASHAQSADQVQLQAQSQNPGTPTSTQAAQPTLSLVQAQPTSQPTNASIKMTARSLFNGYFKYGDWLPVEVNLQNFGPNTDVRVQAQVTNRINGINHINNYQREVSLNERANKRVVFYFIPYVETSNASRSIFYETQIDLIKDGKTITSTSVNLIPTQPTDYLVGTVTPDPNALSNLSNLKVGGQQRSRVSSVHIPLADIPDRADGLRSFDTLVFSEVSTESLTPEQRTALMGWVESGGQLILMGGNSWTKVKGGFNPTQLPFEVTNFSSLSSIGNLLTPAGADLKTTVPLTRPAVLSKAQVTQGSRLLSYFRDSTNAVVPLIAERLMGQGRLVAVAADLAVAPLLEWSGGTQVWQELFAFNTELYQPLYAENNPQIKIAQEVLQFLLTVPDLRLPDVTIYLVLVAIYMAVVAPASYVVLRRMHRLELTWLVLPVLGIAFTVAAIGFSNSQSNGQVLINQLTIIATGPNLETAQVRSYATVFSPDENRYDIVPSLPGGEGTSRLLISPLNRPTSNQTETETSRDVLQGEKPRLEDFQVGQWTAQGFTVETNLPARNFKLEASLRYEGDRVVGSVRNTTGTTLRNTLLMMGDTPMKLRDVIEPNEVVNIDFQLPPPTAFAIAYCSNAFSSTTASTGATPGEKLANMIRSDRRDDKQSEIRSNFVRKFYENGRYNPINTGFGMDFVAWMDDNPLLIDISGQTSQVKSSQVLFSRLPIGVEPGGSPEGRLFLPGSAFRPESAVTSGGQNALTTRNDRTDQICISRGAVEVEYRLPVEQSNFKVSSLNLYLNSLSTGGQRNPILPDSVEFYDYAARSWQTIRNLQNSGVANNTSGVPVAPPPIKNTIDNAGKFADPLTGHILMRFNYSSLPILFIQFALDVEGGR